MIHMVPVTAVPPRQGRRRQVLYENTTLSRIIVFHVSYLTFRRKYVYNTDTITVFRRYDYKWLMYVNIIILITIFVQTVLAVISFMYAIT